MSKRYFFISVHTDGKTNEVIMSCSGFPSRAYISKTIEDEEGSELLGILSIFEFKSKLDYESFLSGRETDVEEIAKPLPNIDYDKFMALFNANCGNIPKISEFTVDRKNKLAALIRNHSKEEVAQVVKDLKEYPFLQGEEVIEGRKAWVATIDWMLKPSNFQKIKEGNYAKREIKKELIKV